MFDSESTWIHQHIKNIESIEVTQQWALSTVLRVRTPAEDFYFKSNTLLPHSADEPRLTALLARLYPAHMPTLIAVDEARGWLLLADVGANLRSLPHDDLWYKALLSFMRLQKDSTAHIDQLLAAGCNDWRAPRLEMLIDPFLNDDAAVSGLDVDETRRLRALAPLLHDHCADLKLTTLVHGDLHGGNIGYKDGVLRFFDWTESCIAHPFFDLVVFLNDASRYLEPEAVVRLRDAYLEQWEHSGQQWQIAAPLAVLHQAMIYNEVARRLNPNAPRKRVAEWLRKMIVDEP